MPPPINLLTRRVYAPEYMSSSPASQPLLTDTYASYQTRGFTLTPTEPRNTLDQAYVEFLSSTLEFLFGVKNTTPQDWLTGHYDFHVAHTQLFQDRQELRETLKEANDKLSEFNRQQVRSDGEYKEAQKQFENWQTATLHRLTQKDKSNSLIASLVPKGKKYRDPINEETQTYLYAVNGLENLKKFILEQAQKCETHREEIILLKDCIQKQGEKIQFIEKQLADCQKKITFAMAFDDERVAAIKNIILQSMPVKKTSPILTPQKTQHEPEVSLWKQLKQRFTNKKSTQAVV